MTHGVTGADVHGEGVVPLHGEHGVDHAGVLEGAETGKAVVLDVFAAVAGTVVG